MASLSKAFDQIRIPLQGKAKVIFKLKNSNNGLDQHDGLAFTDLLPEGLLIDGQPQAAQCGGTVTVSTQDGPLAPALCRRQPAQGRQQLRRDRDRAGPDPGTENQ
ncbi:hypothetical protein WJ970_12945 [Achromobacter xylosoxidans]